ncbi:MAG: phosphate regulon transcriptional regulatory protein PhoB [Haliea sp.]|jgi:two-component system phosphate regulon response regulator PhoB|uniref:phosphate regulon transcriptional regulator PhoB n=1 Tax=Haliea sp. TaxID=1932666 RepID=UPI000C629DF8|nr:phosphate regulon transcriptional regulator PhoB [Haliea sp.]MBM69955.1 phosphate regulon transcriptional regulatory protein PhoB [Haliea sp.]|tara:strand:- start:13600 stop:14310 length:711 start_codon:yes stop_codon:yes gene_type:complete
MNERQVLIVDDEFAIRDMLRMALEIAGFRCLEAENIQDAFTLIVDERPDMVLLDWMLPGGSGLELLRRLKRTDTTRDVPVIMLTAKTAEDNVIQGLDVGADDYITKPFAPRELIARIKALLRRSAGGDEQDRIQVAQLVLDGESRRIFLCDEPVEMGPTEFNLLHFFMSHPERAYTRSQLLDQVWGANVYVEERTVDVHIRRLRKALQTPQADYSDLVQTVRGTGYRFSARGVPAR